MSILWANKGAKYILILIFPKEWSNLVLLTKLGQNNKQGDALHIVFLFYLTILLFLWPGWGRALGKEKIAPAYERLFVPFCQLGSSIRINTFGWAENLLVTQISFVFTKETVASHLFKMIQRISFSVLYSNCDTSEIGSRKPMQQMWSPQIFTDDLLCSKHVLGTEISAL